MTTTGIVRPQKPWKASGKERLVSLGIIALAIVVAVVIVEITPMKGKLAYFSLSFILFIVFDFLHHVRIRGTAAGKDAIARGVVALAITLAVLPMVSIIASVVSRGYKGLHWTLFTKDMKINSVNDPIGQGGLLHAITGSFLMVGVALIISLPLGVLTALYLTEVKGRLSRPIKFLVQAMSGVPSIVAGLFILSAIIIPVTKTYSGFMGSLALSILMIPTIARISEEVLLLIPEDLREAGVALGGTQWRTVAMIVVPAAKAGLMTAVILGIARVVGETAPVILVTGGGDTVNGNPFNGPMGSLPFYVFKALTVGTPESVTRAWAGLLVLLTIVLGLFISARYLSERKAIK